jgi:hypothetical protein
VEVLSCNDPPLPPHCLILHCFLNNMHVFQCTVCTPLPQFALFPYSHARISVRSLYTPASVCTVSLFTCTYFSALFVHPCRSLHCFLIHMHVFQYDVCTPMRQFSPFPYSHARISVRCLYTLAIVSTALIHTHYFVLLFVHPCVSFLRFLIHTHVFQYAVCTPLPQFAPFPYSHARI